MTKTEAKQVARLQKLCQMIRDRAHIWHENCENTGNPNMPRMDRWMQEYDDLRECNGSYTVAWLEYCKITGACETHAAGDLLA